MLVYCSCGGLWVGGTAKEAAAATGKLGLSPVCRPCLRSCARDSSSQRLLLEGRQDGSRWPDFHQTQDSSATERLNLCRTLVSGRRRRRCAARSGPRSGRSARSRRVVAVFLPLGLGVLVRSVEGQRGCLERAKEREERGKQELCLELAGIMPAQSQTIHGAAAVCKACSCNIAAAQT